MNELGCAATDHLGRGIAQNNRRTRAHPHKMAFVVGNEDQIQCGLEEQAPLFGFFLERGVSPGPSPLLASQEPATAENTRANQSEEQSINQNFLAPVFEDKAFG